MDEVILGWLLKKKSALSRLCSNDLSMDCQQGLFPELMFGKQGDVVAVVGRRRR